MNLRTNGRLQIGIIGGGVAGLATAAAFQAAGVRCMIFEQAPFLSEVGAGIQISPNASRLLNRLGLAEPLDAIATRPRSIDVRRWDDARLLAKTPLGWDCVDMFGAPYYTLHRADLHQALLESLPDGTMVLNHRCVAVHSDRDAIRVVFADHTEQSLDVLIGADGIHSVVREMVAVGSPKFSGQVVYRGLVPSQRIPKLRDDPRVLGWFGPNQHFVCYPISGGRLISFSAITPAAKRRTESWSEVAEVRDVAAAYQGWDATVLALIEAAESVTRRALYDHDPLPRWSTPRLTLVGDAAHPMLPFRAQGANQAIEDAVVLAECLRAAEDDVPAALLHYESLRLPRTAEIQRSSREIANAFHMRDGDRQLERDRNMPGQWTLRSQKWLFGYKAEFAATKLSWTVR